MVSLIFERKEACTEMSNDFLICRVFKGAIFQDISTSAKSCHKNAYKFVLSESFWFVNGVY